MTHDEDAIRPRDLDQDHVVVYSMAVVNSLDSVAAAILLGQLTWASKPWADGRPKRDTDAQGFLLFALNDISEACGLKRNALETARKVLEDAGVVETRKGPVNDIRWRLRRRAYLRVTGRAHVEINTGATSTTHVEINTGPRRNQHPTHVDFNVPHTLISTFPPLLEIDRDQKRDREQTAAAGPGIAKGAGGRNAAINERQARNVFAEPEPASLAHLLAEPNPDQRTESIEALWRRHYPDLAADAARWEIATAWVWNYWQSATERRAIKWTWPATALSRMAEMLLEKQDEARKMALANARASAQRVETPADIAHQPAPADATERDAYNRCYPRDGHRPPRTIQIWRDAGRPTSWPPEGADEVTTTPQRVNAPTHAADEKPPMSSQQENEGRAIMLAELAKVTARLTDTAQPQQRALQRAEEATPKETEEAKRARRAEAMRLVAEAKRKASG